MTGKARTPGQGQVAWDETGLTDAARVQRRLQACREHGLRPTLLLNAHHGVPCPTQFSERHLTAAAAATGGIGLLPANLTELPEDVTFAQAATPPLQALQRLTASFADCVPVAAPRQLTVATTALDEGREIFRGDATHPPLRERELLAVLPFQRAPDASMEGAGPPVN